MPAYHPEVIEPKWQTYWESNKTFRTIEDPAKPKYYILDMFPYPSGDGLHVGHPEGYTATDILARYRRMNGYNVLHPMGWDAFGLPAEQYAIETGKHPRQTTGQNIATFRRQIKMLGFSYDWDREVDTTDPNYFKWTQWIFLQLFDSWFDIEANRGRPISQLPIPAAVQARGDGAIRTYQDSKRLAYQAEMPVNWCPVLGTVLANEEVVDGRSDRGNHPVVRLPLRQWLLRITAYAERLLADLDQVEWPESIKKMQREWIGRSEGAEVDFQLVGRPEKIRIFTTRPDTLFGATYMVLSPEHPLVEVIATKDQAVPVRQYQQEAARKSDLERTELAKKKTGVFTGAFAFNPVNNERIPIWIADYVLSGYGTGAIMAVPAHDERDFEFASQFGLQIRVVVEPPMDWLRETKIFQIMSQNSPGYGSRADMPAPTMSAAEAKIFKHAARLMSMHSSEPLRVTEGLYFINPELFDEVFVGEGRSRNSHSFDGLPSAEFKSKIIDWLEKKHLGQRKVNYKLRDWLFSRQRYWGEPFPILHELDAGGKPTGQIRAVDVGELPLTLPEMDDYKPSGKPEPPLGKAIKWMEVEKNGVRYLRETNTMPQWAGSCWYYLRYLDPTNSGQFCAPDKENYWMPVDLYVGGAEHAVLHLLYSRFWHKVLFDRGRVHTAEPFMKLVNQGMILGEMEFTGFQKGEDWISATCVNLNDGSDKKTGEKHERVRLREDQVEKKGHGFVLKDHPEIRVDARAYKMSKSRRNVINPDHVVKEYGADSVRLYEMFMGPLEATKPWSMRGVEGVYRFLGRVWRLIVDDRSESTMLSAAVADIIPDAETTRKLHQTIKKVTDDLDGMRFNTAIAALMELVNHLTQLEIRPRSVIEKLVLLLSPFAPHLAEESWSILGHAHTLSYEPWPTYDEALTREAEVEIPVQVNGKIKCKLMVPAEVDEATLREKALTEVRVAAALDGKQIRKVIIVPGKLVNIVVG